jgi:hypothetical protein
MELALHLHRLALLRGRFLERRSLLTLHFGPGRGISRYACIQVKSS